MSIEAGTLLPHLIRTDSNSNLDMLLELGRVHYYNLSFGKAEQYLKLAQKNANTDDPNYIDVMHEVYGMLMRIYSERCENERYEDMREQYQVLLEKNPETTQYFAKYQALQGVQKFSVNDYEGSQKDFEAALSHAKKYSNNRDLAVASYGLASCYYRRGDFDSCMTYLGKIYEIIEDLDYSDLDISVIILHGHVLRCKHDYKSALETFDSALKLAKKKLNWYFYQSTLYNIALVNREMGYLDRAREMFEALIELIDNTELVYLQKMARKELESLKSSELTINIQTRTVTHRNGNSLSFNNRFILMDILVLLAQSAGREVSKDEFCRSIWGSEYTPLLHDNKIYYNINRLRNMLSTLAIDDLIMTSKDGYLLNNTINVAIKD